MTGLYREKTKWHWAECLPHNKKFAKANLFVLSALICVHLRPDTVFVPAARKIKTDMAADERR